jgi:hypothetical protein
VSDRPILALFAQMVEYCLARKLSAENGLFVTVEKDKRWQFAIAGREAKAFEPPGGMEVALNPFHFAIWWNGWLAGIGTAFEGEIAAGEGANEQAFSEALR